MYRIGLIARFFARSFGYGKRPCNWSAPLTHQQDRLVECGIARRDHERIEKHTMAHTNPRHCAPPLRLAEKLDTKEYAENRKLLQRVQNLLNSTVDAETVKHSASILAPRRPARGPGSDEAWTVHSQPLGKLQLAGAITGY